MDSAAMDDAHAAAARSAHEHCFANLPAANAYAMSAEEAVSRGMARQSNEADLTYGDVPYAAIARSLAMAAPRDRAAFVDLGSGVARGVVAAALLWPFEHCIGIEIMSSLHAAAAEPVEVEG